MIMERFLFEGNISVKAAIMGNVRPVHEILVADGKKDRDTVWILHRAIERGIPIRTMRREDINAIAQGHTHGGLLAWCGERTFQNIEQCDDQEQCFLALVEGIEDPFNFGSVLRTLYASGCNGVILTRHWQLASSVIARCSAGASEYLPLIYAQDLPAMIERLHQRRINILCGERKNAVSLYDYSFPSRFVLAIGGEMRGLSKPVLQASDQTIYIPYGRDVRNALNAVSATAVFSFEILRQRIKNPNQ